MGPQQSWKRESQDPSAAQAWQCSPLYTDPAPVGRLGDHRGTASTEPVFKKEGEEVLLAGP